MAESRKISSEVPRAWGGTRGGETSLNKGPKARRSLVDLRRGRNTATRAREGERGTRDGQCR